MVDCLQELAVRQLRELDGRRRLIVIHPNYAQQHLVLAELLQKKILYVRFEGQLLAHPEIETQINCAIATQGKPDEVTKATLVLDECDRVEDVALSEFLHRQLQKIAYAQIIILGRRLSQHVLANSTLREQLVFVPGDASLMLWDYAEFNHGRILLEVRAFGEGQVLLNGQQIDDWDGTLPRALFFYLVDRGMATRDDIFKTFWPEKSMAEATNVFHVTKRKINEILGVNLTTYGGGFYRLSPKIELGYDAVLFTGLLREAEVTPADQIETIIDRVKLFYKGSFLYALDMPWVEKRRDELGEEYGHTLETLADGQEAIGNKKIALNFYLQAMALCSPDEERTLKVMRLYREFDMISDALMVYEQYRSWQSGQQLSLSVELGAFASKLRKLSR